MKLIGVVFGGGFFGVLLHSLNPGSITAHTGGGICVLLLLKQMPSSCRGRRARRVSPVRSQWGHIQERARRI